MLRRAAHENGEVLLRESVSLTVFADLGSETSRMRTIRVQRFRRPTPAARLLFLSAHFHVLTLVGSCTC